MRVDHHRGGGREEVLATLKRAYISLFVCRELWRREAAFDQTIQSARDELSKCERNLHSTVGKVKHSLNSSTHY